MRRVGGGWAACGRRVGGGCRREGGGVCEPHASHPGLIPQACPLPLPPPPHPTPTPPLGESSDHRMRSESAIRITPDQILHREGRTDREVEVGGVEGEGHNEHVEQWVPMHHEGAHRRAPRERGKGRHTVSKPLVAASVVKVAWACGILNKKNWERVLCQ